MSEPFDNSVIRRWVNQGASQPIINDVESLRAELAEAIKAKEEAERDTARLSWVLENCDRLWCVSTHTEIETMSRSAIDAAIRALAEKEKKE